MIPWCHIPPAVRTTVFWNGDRYCVEVIHNVKAGGVIISPLEEFADGPVQLVARPSSPEHAKSILAIAGANHGKSYSEPVQGITKLVVAGAVLWDYLVISFMTTSTNMCLL